MEVRNLLSISDAEFLQRGIKNRNEARRKKQIPTYHYWRGWVKSFRQTMKAKEMVM